MGDYLRHKLGSEAMMVSFIGLISRIAEGMNEYVGWRKNTEFVVDEEDYVCMYVLLDSMMQTIPEYERINRSLAPFSIHYSPVRRHTDEIYVNPSLPKHRAY